MSARTRSILYKVFLFLIGIGAVIGTVLVALNGWEPSKTNVEYVWAFAFAIVFLIILPVNGLVHETGHLLFGLVSGMRFASMRLGRVRVMRVGKKLSFRLVSHRDVVGSCEMYPKNEKHVRGRMLTYALGGAVFNLAYAIPLIVFAILYPVPSPALYFFQLFAPLSLVEGLACLYPTVTATGSTDGEIIRSLSKNEPSAVVSLHVLTAQGMLAHKQFSEIEKSFLYELPVVREDDIAFLAITQLRWQYAFYTGDEAEALAQLSRLESLYDYLPELNRGDVACDFVYAYSVLQKDEQKAEHYLAETGFAKGTCSYFRAMAAYSKLFGREGEYLQFLTRARALAEEEMLYGVSRLEIAYLERLSLEE